MDNKGGNGSNPGEALVFPAPPETPPQMEAPVDLGEVQEMANEAAPTEEMSENTEQMMAPAGEKPLEMPPMMPEAQAKPAAEEQETPALTKLKSINIPRDAESLPKEYVDTVAKIIEVNKKDPWQEVEDVADARWDLMSKAFGRNLGDGLNGQGKAA